MGEGYLLASSIFRFDINIEEFYHFNVIGTLRLCRLSKRIDSI